MHQQILEKRQTFLERRGTTTWMTWMTRRGVQTQEDVPAPSGGCSETEERPAGVRRRSVAGVLAVGAVAHVLGVELHLDGDAVEAKLGVQQVRGLLQDGLGVRLLL